MIRFIRESNNQYSAPQSGSLTGLPQNDALQYAFQSSDFLDLNAHLEKMGHIAMPEYAVVSGLGQSSSSNQRAAKGFQLLIPYSRGATVVYSRTDTAENALASIKDGTNVTIVKPSGEQRTFQSNRLQEAPSRDPEHFGGGDIGTPPRPEPQAPDFLDCFGHCLDSIANFLGPVIVDLIIAACATCIECADIPVPENPACLSCAACIGTFAISGAACVIACIDPNEPAGPGLQFTPDNPIV